VRKGSGQEADNLQPVVYECYGPAGLGIIIEATTENLNRTLGNIRANLNKYGGSLASRGALNFVFAQKGVFVLDAPAPEQADEVEMLLIDAGADDVQRLDQQWEVHCAFEDFGPMVQALHDAGILPREANLQRIPVIFKRLTADDARLALKLIAKLEEDDDIDTVYHNIEFSEELATQLIASGDI
jgi:YebC/PmpR family DNA-binding regulatory protein